MSIFGATEDEEMDYNAEDEDEENGVLSEWLKEWVKKEHVSEKIRRVAER